ncbi:hypothetical protein Mapa_008898 [Marchantia paleacea]|nr:hypothetical protein Mapa_008898 [Marchantia paleacea]
MPLSTRSRRRRTVRCPDSSASARALAPRSPMKELSSRLSQSRFDRLPAPMALASSAMAPLSSASEQSARHRVLTRGNGRCCSTLPRAEIRLLSSSRWLPPGPLEPVTTTDFSSSSSSSRRSSTCS